MTKAINNASCLYTVILIAFLAGPAGADWSYPGCTDVNETHFRENVLVGKTMESDASLNEPIEMAFDAVTGSGGQMEVNMYFIERGGKVKMYDGQSGSVSVVASLNVCHDCAGATQEGLVGIALDPKFKENGWMYLYYSPVTPVAYRVSRFTLSDGVLDEGSEKVLLEIPVLREQGVEHTGGSMAFDNYGDLWIAVGHNLRGDPQTINENDKNFSDEWGAASTASMRGSILRIHPDNSPKGYSIPGGNFCEYFANLGAGYLDPAKCLPELYVKGNRAVYTITLDPVRQWMTWGEPGPNRAELHEESNMVKHPVFAGYPYFAGANLPLEGGKNPAAPVNNSVWNQGVQNLPPATPATYPYRQRCAITGPVYRYDPALNSDIKMPPHFHRKWFTADYNTSSWVKVFTMDAAWDTIAMDENIFSGINFDNILDFEAGPDGAFYFVNYGGGASLRTRISRVEYTGPPCDVGTEFQRAGCMDPLAENFDGSATEAWPDGCVYGGSPVRGPAGAGLPGIFALRGSLLEIAASGPYSLEVLSPMGEKVHMHEGQGPGFYQLRDLHAGSGVQVIRVTADHRTAAVKAVYFSR